MIGLRMEEPEKKCWFVFPDVLVFGVDFHWNPTMDLKVKDYQHLQTARQMIPGYAAALLDALMKVFVAFVVVMLVWQS